jgi:hypothetical protein
MLGTVHKVRVKKDSENVMTVLKCYRTKVNEAANCRSGSPVRFAVVGFSALMLLTIEGYMKTGWWWKIASLLIVLTVGCVTQTERISYHRYYDPPENESVLDELRREFGWQKPPPWVKEEPFYTRAARGVKETVTGWFRNDEPTGSFPHGLQTMQDFQRAQQDAIQRLQQRNTEEDSPTAGATNDSLAPATGETANGE